MKKIFLGVLFAIISTLTFGQTITGSFAGLADSGKAKIIMDFSEASIHGMSEEDFEYMEPDWSKDLPQIIGYFVGEVADRLNGFVILGSNVKSEYSINVRVISISTKGNYVCDAIIKDGEKEVAKIQGVKADGGNVGTKLNLIKDGAEHTGKQLGRILLREIKKSKRKK